MQLSKSFILGVMPTPVLLPGERRTGNSHNQKSGGGERDRTDDLLRAKQALSQLSYTPDPNPLASGL